MRPDAGEHYTYTACCKASKEINPLPSKMFYTGARCINHVDIRPHPCRCPCQTGAQLQACTYVSAMELKAWDALTMQRDKAA